jgi:CBS domain-containing protein
MNTVRVPSPLVADIMRRKPIAVRTDVPIEQLILILIDENLSAVPVVDDRRRPVGVVTRSDVVLDRYDWAELRDEMLSRRPGARTSSGVDIEDELYVNGLLRSRTVGDLMSANPAVVAEDTPVPRAAALLVARGFEGCPVVDGSGKLAGTLSLLDIASWVASLETDAPGMDGDEARTANSNGR